MTNEKFTPGPIHKFDQELFHPGGRCTCAPKHRRIVRRYLRYGLCLTCGKLTGFKLLRTGRC